MKRILDYFLVKHNKESLIIRNKAKTLVVINLVGSVFVFAFFVLNVRSNLDQNDFGKILLPFILFLFFIINLFLIRKLSFKIAGSVFASSIIFIESLGVLLNNHHTSDLSTYLSGFYMMMVMLSLGALFSTKWILLLNALFVYITVFVIFFTSKNLYTPEILLQAQRALTFYIFGLTAMVIIFFLLLRITEKSTDIELDNIVQITKKNKNLSFLLEKISESSNLQKSLRKKVLSNTKQLHSAMNEQIFGMNEISKNVNEILTSIQISAEHAQHTITDVNKILSFVKSSEQSFKITSQKVHAIFEKIEVISEIAKRTDFLAINAAIEASRAGEKGKGFSVVSSEIRKLAESSQFAASEIISFVKETISVTDESEKYLLSLISEMYEVADAIKLIVSDIIQQKESVSQINDIVLSVNNNSLANFNVYENLQNSMNILSENAKKMEKLAEINKKGF